MLLELFNIITFDKLTHLFDDFDHLELWYLGLISQAFFKGANVAPSYVAHISRNINSDYWVLQ